MKRTLLVMAAVCSAALLISLETEIVTLNAEILEVTTESDAHWVSVRFTGLLREDGAETAHPFDEAWNLTRPVSGKTGWLLAGIQQLQ